jgi:hypothetical protein
VFESVFLVLSKIIIYMEEKIEESDDSLLQIKKILNLLK